jgi:hypothetical protein
VVIRYVGVLRVDVDGTGVAMLMSCVVCRRGDDCVVLMC